MTNEVEKATAAPMPLPPSAWRITNDLQTAIERCLTEAGHQILESRFSDNNYRHWQLGLLFGQTVDVSVDSHISPGTLKIIVHGDDAQPIRTLLKGYQKMPILKISTTVTTSELLNRVPETVRRQMPRSLAGRLKFAIRYCVTYANYKIVGQNIVYPATWVVCLKTTQQLAIKGFSMCAERELNITGFCTDLARLEQLMAVFDTTGGFAIPRPQERSR